MAGLQNNSIHALMQWRQLFIEQNNTHSVQDYTHWQNIEQLGLPDCKHEHWKYTPLEELFSHRFTSATTRMVTEVERDVLSLMLNAYRLVFVDGFFSPSLSDNDIGFWQIKIEEGIARQPLQKAIQPEVFLHLTECLSQQTTYIILPKGKTSSRPLYLLHISQGMKSKKDEDKDILSTLNYRHHIIFGAESSGLIIEHFASISTKPHFSGARTSIDVGDNAHCHHIKLVFENRSSYHFAHNDIYIGYNAVVRSNTFILGTKLTKHQTSVQLNGEGSDLSINSLLISPGENISDNRSYVEHNKSHCLSRQLHKIIVCGHGKGVFNGLVKVNKCALKTNGQMINNNLLLDHLAEVNTKPQLEIYADDVKCSHGVTIGLINKEQVFYLRSRGITSLDAKRMIIYAFAAEVTEKINHDAIRNTMLVYISQSLEEVVR